MAVSACDLFVRSTFSSLCALFGTWSSDSCLCVVCFCLDISGSGLASPLCLTLFLWSSDLVLVQCYLLCSLHLVVFVCSFWF